MRSTSFHHLSRVALGSALALVSGAVLGACASDVSTPSSVSSPGGISGSNPGTSTASPITPGVGARSAQTSERSCRSTDLSYSLSTPRQSNGTTRWTAPVELVNKASYVCVMSGYPGVTLVGDTLADQKYSWVLAHARSGGIQRVVLQPGGQAHFDLIYIAGDPAGGTVENTLAVRKMVIKAPGEADPGHSLDWDANVVNDDGSMRPQTYVSAVLPGS